MQGAIQVLCFTFTFAFFLHAASTVSTAVTVAGVSTVGEGMRQEGRKRSSISFASVCISPMKQNKKLSYLRDSARRRSFKVIQGH